VLRNVLSAHHLHSQVIHLRIRHLRKKERKLVPVFLWYTDVKRDRVEAAIPQPADIQLDYRAGNGRSWSDGFSKKNQEYL